MPQPFEAGGLLSTDVQQVTLGRHHGVELMGEVVHRTLRIGIGGRRGVRLELSRARPTSVTARDAAGERRHVMPANPDPWLEAAQRLIALTVATSLLPWLLRRRRRFAQRAAE